MAVDLIAMFAQDLELRGMAPGTCATYCRVLRQFSRYFEAIGNLLECASNNILATIVMI